MSQTHGPAIQNFSFLTIALLSQLVPDIQKTATVFKLPKTKQEMGTMLEELKRQRDVILMRLTHKSVVRGKK